MQSQSIGSCLLLCEIILITFRGWKELSRRACIVCQVESLKNEQEKTTELEAKMKEVVKERDSLNRQLSQSLPQVSELTRDRLSHRVSPGSHTLFIPNAF